MYVYIESEHTPDYSLQTVGFYDPSGKWNPESDHSKAEEAAKRVAFLNGKETSAQLIDALEMAESFIAGFEGDVHQEGIDVLLTKIRTALGR
ncbi:hypothetical protein [Burkholderia cepacia]|uniref:hypothetical protein n=1 Tax=Burkholderia cepacia TaxID=292 RepID=UPI002AB7ED52|nr:hypothetical protein [Burkholderia cepacia]